MKLLKSLALLALLVPTLLSADETPNRVPVGEAEASLEQSGFIFDQYPPVYYSSSHHWVVAITVLDNDKYTLELEDGSVWKIHRYDGEKILNWRANDPLTLTQNHSWFSSHKYRIINKSNGSTVDANLHLGPIEQGTHTRYIIAIDYDRKEIVLSDNTHHEISYLDHSIFKDWKLSHAVIIGTNSGWDSDSELLLINVNLNNHVRAKQF